MEKKKKQMLAFWCDPDSRDFLELVAEKEKRSVGEIIRLAITQFKDKNKEKYNVR